MTILRRVIRGVRRRIGIPEPAQMLAERFPQFDIGRGSYGDLSVQAFGEGASLRVGAYCSVAAGVQVFLGGEHRTDWVTTYPFNVIDRRFADITGHPRTRGDVVIGNDVWLGREAMIMSGVTIGDGAVVGARAVVARDVPPYGIVAGNPAKLIRTRFSETIVMRLLEIRWWEWPEDRVSRAIRDLQSDDIEAFIRKVDRGLL
jgi:chloramphenicol O-acetyltransferase type B